jgi:hypothetical protein
MRREVFCYSLIEFGIPMKLIKLLKVCLIETCGKVRIGKNRSYESPIQNDLKKGGAF